MKQILGYAKIKKIFRVFGLQPLVIYENFGLEPILHCTKASTLTPGGGLNIAYKYSAADWTC